MKFFKKDILHVLDPSHKYWVQGGVFSDLRDTSKIFIEKPIYLPPPNSPKNFVAWLWKCFEISLHRKILFSSITPLLNYKRYPFRLKKNKLALWFTHTDHDFSRIEIKALRSCETIFIHSKNSQQLLRQYSDAKLTPFLGAINPDRFKEMASIGKKVVWAGTCVERKRPQLFLETVTNNQSIEFRLIGKDWRKSNYWKLISNLSNLEYIEFEGPLNSEILDGCNTYLMTSSLEGGPMPLIETLAAGLYPVCTDTGFVSDVLDYVDLPKVFITPDSSHIAKQISEVSEISIEKRLNFRNKILNLDFQRLTNIINIGLDMH